MRIELNDKLYDYATIAQFVDMKGNGATVHKMKGELALIREIMIDVTTYGADDKDEQLLLAALKAIGYIK